MCGNDDPPELQEILQSSPVLTEPEDQLVELGEGITMISVGCSNRTPWHTPREMDDADLEQRIEKLAAGVARPERAVFNLHVPPARTGLDLAPALDDSLKPQGQGRRRGDGAGRVRGGAAGSASESGFMPVRRSCSNG